MISPGKLDTRKKPDSAKPNLLLFKSPQYFCLPRRHSSESWNPGWLCRDGCKRPGFSRFALANALNRHPRLLAGRDVLSKPLDSSAFVPDAALPPASMQAGLRLPAAGRPE